MKSLPINLDRFSFVEREKIGGQHVKYRCGRDFLYYGLHYYLPRKFNKNSLNPETIEKQGFFGMKLPWWLMWTQLQFIKLPKYLRENDLQLLINKKPINRFIDLVFAILFSRMNLGEALKIIDKSIDEGKVVGIDISLGIGGLLDHVMFVYGYESDVLYVCDTHKVPMLEYSKVLDDNHYLMKLPKDIIQKRWTKFGRVWELGKI